MNSTPAISVIIPNYNHAAYLDRRIRSVLQQTYTDYEIIVLDDRSTDTSLEVIRQYAEHPKISRIVANDKNSGSPFIQWQKGVALADGKYIWIAESDDAADPHFLERLVPAIEHDTSIALAYAQSYDINENDEIIGSRLRWTKNFSPNIWQQDFICEGDIFIERYLAYKNVIPNASAVLFRKKVFLERYDSTSTKMRMAGDWLLWISILHGHRIAFISTPLNFFREHGKTSRVHDNLQKKMNRVLEEVNITNKISAIPGISKATTDRLKAANLIKWFRLFPYATAVFNKDFYKICSYNHMSPLGLLVKKTKAFVVRHAKK